MGRQEEKIQAIYSGSKKMNEPSMKKKAINNSIWGAATNLISKIGGLIFSVIVARLLFPELFGVYTLALTVVLIVFTIIDSGVNTTMARFVSESLKKEDKKSRTEARARFYYLARVKIVLTGIIALALFLLAEFLAFFVFSEPLLTLPIRVGAFYLLATSIESILSSTTLAVQKLSYKAYSETINQLVRVVLVLIFLRLYVSVETVFATMVLSSLVALILLYFLLSKNYPYLFKGEKGILLPRDKKRMFSFFGWSSLAFISLAFFAQIDTFMLGILLPSEFVGYYAVIFSIVSSVGALITFTGVLLPIFTQVKKKNLEHAFQEVLRYVLIIGLPAAAGLAFIISPLIRFIYGGAYLPEEHKFAITLSAALLSFLVLEFTLSSTYMIVFQSRERPRILAKIIISAAILNAILNYFFITNAMVINVSYGLVGATTATLISSYGKLAGMIFFTKKSLRINSLRSPGILLKPAFATAIMSVSLLYLIYDQNLSVKWLVFIVFIAVLVYFFTLWIVGGLDRADLEILRSLFRKRRVN